MSFFKELKRRNVFKVGIAYAVTTWVLLQLTDTVTEILSLPDWAPKLILLMLLVGFVPALILAWAFELTPEGIKLEKDVPKRSSMTSRTGRKLDYLIIISLGLSLGYFIWESRFEQKTAEYESAVAAQSAGAETIVEAEPETAPAPEPEPVIQSELVADANSIAVLPFANRSADADDIYFTDGIHDDLLTQLAKIDAFSVISRTAVMEYRGTTKNLRQIARELSVANIMEGSVQRAGDRVRINVQLIDAKTDEHLWAEIYDREMTTNNLFDIQSEIARAIATALKATLTDAELADVADVPTDNVGAYDLYLRSKRFTQNETHQDYQVSIELLTEALQLDPNFKHAWTGLALAHMTNYWSYGGDIKDRDLALAAIERAREIDNNFAELFVVEGIYWYWGFLDYERALYKLDKAIEMMPGNSEAFMWRGWVSRRSGLWDKALESMQVSLKLNPRVHFNWHEYATTLQYLHDYSEARKAAQQSLAIDPDSFWGKSTLANILIQESGDIEKAFPLTIGLQYSYDYSFFDTYLRARLMSRRFDEALEVARGLSTGQEIQRNTILLKESLSAQILHFMNRRDEAKQAADAALFRLNRLKLELGRDYRTDMAEAMILALQEGPADDIKALIRRSDETSPQDDVNSFERAFKYARIYGIAGMVEETIKVLEPIFSPPSETSIFNVALDPAFDSVRSHADFQHLIDRHK